MSEASEELVEKEVEEEEEEHEKGSQAETSYTVQLWLYKV